jgi:hypothetical protein
MSTTPTPGTGASKVVVACVDGRRLKGFVFNFSSIRDAFRLFPEPTARQDSGTDVQLRELKAIFFVKDFAGNADRHDSQELKDGARGRKLEIVFADGEKICGTTEAYDPQKAGFFMFPADGSSNNSRILL